MDFAEPSHYEILGVPHDVSPAQLRRAYHRMILDTHPDSNPGSQDPAAALMRVRDAYAVLSDDQLRSEYDALLSKPAASIPGAQEPYVLHAPRFMVADADVPSARPRPTWQQAAFWLAAAVSSAVLVVALATLFVPVRATPQVASTLQNVSAPDAPFAAWQVLRTFHMGPTTPPGTILTTARSLMDARNSIAATDLLRAALVYYPGAPDLHSALAEAYAMGGMDDGSIAEFRESCWLDPRNVDRLESLANALQSHHRYFDAVAPLRLAIKLNPEDTSALVAYGDVRRTQHDNADAAAAYLAALRTDPGCVTARIGMEQILAQDAPGTPPHEQAPATPAVPAR